MTATDAIKYGFKRLKIFGYQTVEHGMYPVFSDVTQPAPSYPLVSPRLDALLPSPPSTQGGKERLMTAPPAPPPTPPLQQTRAEKEGGHSTTSKATTNSVDSDTSEEPGAIRRVLSGADSSGARKTTPQHPQ